MCILEACSVALTASLLSTSQLVLGGCLLLFLGQELLLLLFALTDSHSEIFSEYLIHLSLDIHFDGNKVE